MAPELVGALVLLGSLVLVLGAVFGAYFLGRDSERSRAEVAIARAEAAEAALAKDRARAAESAIGEAAEHAAAVDLAGAVAAGDLERVREQFPDRPGSAPSAEPRGDAEQAGGGGDV